MYLPFDIDHFWAYRGSHLQTAAAFFSIHVSSSYIFTEGNICTYILLSETDVWLDVIYYVGRYVLYWLQLFLRTQFIHNLYGSYPTYSLLLPSGSHSWPRVNKEFYLSVRHPENLLVHIKARDVQ